MHSAQFAPLPYFRRRIKFGIITAANDGTEFYFYYITLASWPYRWGQVLRSECYPINGRNKTNTLLLHLNLPAPLGYYWQETFTAT